MDANNTQIARYPEVRRAAEGREDSRIPFPAADVFLGRQPILDRRQRVIAYELLYRDGRGNAAQVGDDALATARVIAHLFQDFGINSVLGRCEGFINVDAETLMSRGIESLPKARVVLELLETVQVDKHIVRRCRELKQQGFRLALDDFSAYDKCYEPLLEMVDIVKIDLLEIDHAALANLVRRLRLYPARLLAEKVESWEMARRCLTLGFNFFQGFLFGRPTVLAL
jgi:EAL and modified HD-GYP domain-containing signal transduction protein